MSIAPHAGHDSQIMPEHNLQGTTVDATDPARLRQAVALALHYRGDVSITLRNAQVIEGYTFDCRMDRAAGTESVRIIPAGREERIAVPLADIAKLAFTGRDTASGKSFETWVKKYVEKKTAGESASIESEALD
jgi:hypothetical protein